MIGDETKKKLIRDSFEEFQTESERNKQQLEEQQQAARIKKTSLAEYEDFDQTLAKGESQKFLTQKELANGDEDEQFKSTNDLNGRTYSIWSLYRFSNSLDKLLLSIGLLFAIVDGSGPALMAIVFGGMADTFIDTIRESEQQEQEQQAAASNDATPAIAGNSSAMAPPDQNWDQFEALMGQFTLMYIFLGILIYVASSIQMTCWQVVCERVVHRTRKAFMRSILRQELQWFDKNQSGALSVKLNDDVERYRDGIGEQVGAFVKQTSTFFAGFIVGFTYSWQLTLVILAVSPILAVVTAFVGRMMATSATREQQKYAGAGAIAEEALSAVRTVFALNGQTQQVAQYKRKIHEGLSLAYRKYWAMSLAFGFSFVVLYGTYGLALYTGAWLLDSGLLTPGRVMSVIMAVMVSSSALGNILPPLQVIAISLSSARTIFSVIDSQPAIDAYSDVGLRLSKVTANIRFDKVSFAYPSRSSIPVLKEFSFQVRQGKTVAICGRTGSGKSTIVNLLLRFYDPTGGTISLDECDLKDLNVAWLRSLIGTVEQEPALFDASVHDNIALGAAQKSDTSRDRIVEAAKVANAHDFIMQLPDAYETRCGNRGVQMSGGQRQRIAIARAILRDPKILLLDEATSALDSVNEAIVQAALNRARRGRTTIIIAHRLSTIKDADTILVMQAGRLVEAGTHEDLLEKKGEYFDLVTNQVFESDLTPPRDLGPGGVPLSSTEDEDAIAGVAGKLLIPRGRGRSRRAKGQVEPDELSLLNDDSSEEEEAQAAADAAAASNGESWQESSLLLHSSQSHAARSTGGASSSGTNGATRRQRRTSTNIYESVNKRRAAELRLAEASNADKCTERAGIGGLLWLMKEEKWLIIGGTISSILFGILLPIFGLLYAQILQTLSLTGQAIYDSAAFWSVMFLILGFANMVAVISRIMLMSRTIENCLSRVRVNCFTQYMRQQVGWFDMPANAPQRLTTRLASDAPEIKSVFNARVGALISGSATIVFSLIIAFYLGWQLAILLTLVIPLLLLVGYLQIRLSRGNKALQSRRMEAASRLATEAIEQVKIIKAINKEEHFCQLFELELREPLRDAMSTARKFGAIYGISQSCIYFVYAVAFRFGAFLIAQQQMSVMNVFRSFFTVAFTATAVGQWGGFTGDFQRAEEAIGRIIRTLKMQTSIDNMSKGGIMPRLRGAVVLRDVHFSYPTRPDTPVLRGLNLSVQPGQTVAIVGSSGNGKSTIASLLLRFYDPDRGSVLIDDFDVRCINLAHLRTNIGLVSQEPTLFRASIRENILFGLDATRYSMRDIIRVCKMANVHDFIATLPRAYETQVGERGTQLSGGQKQRIAIARTMIRNPTILVLDEATSALDAESEKLVDEALERASRGKTCIKIAHRLSTVRDADQIAVMDSGRIVEMGTHAELMAVGRKGHYFRLMQKQHQ